MFRTILAKLRRRLARDFFECTIELRQRLKPDRESDVGHATLSILQKRLRFFDSCAADVIDEVFAGYLFEFFAQIIRTDIHRPGDCS